MNTYPVAIWVKGKSNAQIHAAITECVKACGTWSVATNELPERIILRFGRGQQAEAA